MGLWSGGQAIPLIKQMFGRKNFLVQATPFNESPLTLDFDIIGVEEAVKGLRTACDW
jgi:type VI secretion system protein VasI